MQSSWKTFGCAGPSDFHTGDFYKPDLIFIGPIGELFFYLKSIQEWNAASKTNSALH